MDKISLSELRKELAQRLQIEETKAGSFLSALFEEIARGLQESGQVKAGALGTFKTQWNEPRKSVNVATGEPTIINGHHKVVFTANPDLKAKKDESGNAVDNDPIRKLGAQAEEIKGLISELMEQDEKGKEEAEKAKQAEEEKRLAEEKKKQEKEQEEKRLAEEKEKQEKEQEEKRRAEREARRAEEQRKAEEAARAAAEEKAKVEKKKKLHPALVSLIIIMAFAVLLAGAYFLLQDKITTYLENFGKETPTFVETEITPENAAAITPALPTDSTETVSTEAGSAQGSWEPYTEAQLQDAIDEVAEEDLGPEPMIDGERIYDQWLATEVVRPGSRLVQIARRYYNNPDCWVYIYEANRNQLNTPSDVEVGMELKIPVLPDYLTDANNERAKQQAQDLQKLYSGK